MASHGFHPRLASVVGGVLVLEAGFLFPPAVTRGGEPLGTHLVRNVYHLDGRRGRRGGHGVPLVSL